MVHDEIFHTIVPEGKGHMCIECLEGQLGRRLNPADFTNAPCNYITDTPIIRSRASYFDDSVAVDFTWYDSILFQIETTAFNNRYWKLILGEE